jgi:trimethylguanosine synthase
MPKGRPSRSLFASLPAELKFALRTQDVEPFVGNTVQVKSEILEGINPNNLLPTQPSNTSDTNLDIDSTIQVTVSQEPAHSVEPRVTSTQAPLGQETPAKARSVVLKRTVEDLPTPSSSRSRAAIEDSGRKRRKGKAKAIENHYLNHPWDCMGLVPRYTDYSDVPSELSKCESTPSI